MSLLRLSAVKWILQPSNFETDVILMQLMKHYIIDLYL